MNMMVNTSDLVNEADTETNNKIAQKKALSKLLAAWESKSAQKAKTFGGLGFLAVSLAACNSSSDDTATTAAPTTPAEPATPTVVTNTPQALTDSTTADVLIGNDNNDTFSGTTLTFANADQIVDSSTADADTFTLVFNAAATPNVRNVETITVELQNVGQVALVATSISGGKVLNISRGDLSLAGSTVTGNKVIDINDYDAAALATVNITGTVASVDIDSAATDTAGGTINANTATGAVDINAPATINAAESTGTVSISAAVNASEAGKAATINAAKATTVTTNDALTGVITINAAAATTITVSGGSGGGSISGTLGGTTGIRVDDIDLSGFTITTGSYASTAAGTINVGGTVATTDAVTISAAGSINLNISNDTSAVDVITLGANGANVTYTISVSNGEATSYAKAAAAAGSQASTFTVTLAGDEARFAGKAVTGIDVLDLTAGTAATVDGSLWTAAKVDLGFDNAGNAITYNAGAVYEITKDQTTGLALDSKATNTEQTIKIISGDDNGTSTAVGTVEVNALTLDDGNDTRSGTATIEANDSNFTATSMDMGAKMSLVITGDEDVTLGTVTGGAASSINAAASTGKISLTTTTLAPTVTTGEGADTVVINGADIHTVSTNGGNDDITVTSTDASSSFAGGAGDDAFTLTDVDVYVASGGAGNDTFTTGAAIGATVAGGDGSTDKITLTGAVTFATTMRMSGIEAIDITAANGVFQLDAASFASDNTFALTGNAAADIFRVLADDLGATIDASEVTVASGSTVTIRYEGGNKADTITGGVAAETFFHSGGGDTIEGGGTGTDTYSITDSTIAAGANGVAATSAAAQGIIINLGATNLSSGSIYAGIGKYAAAGVDVGAGKAMYAYAANAAANDADTESISGIETFELGDGLDYFQGSSNAETVDGNAAKDYIDTGDGDDTITVQSTAGDYATGEQLHGGLGEDTMVIKNTVTFSTTDAEVSGIEKITMDSAATVILTGQTEAFTTTVSDVVTSLTTGAGVDTISLTAGTAANTAQFIATSYTASNNGDVITGFDTTEDKLSFDGVTGVTATSGTAIAANATAANVIDAAVYVFADGNDGTNTEDIDTYTGTGYKADVGAFLAAAFADEAANDEFVAVINDVAGNKTYAYAVDFDDGNGGIGALDADAVTLIATITEESNAALVHGDIA